MSTTISYTSPDAVAAATCPYCGTGVPVEYEYDGTCPGYWYQPGRHFWCAMPTSDGRFVVVQVKPNGDTNLGERFASRLAADEAAKRLHDCNPQAWDEDYVARFQGGVKSGWWGYRWEVAVAS